MQLNPLVFDYVTLKLTMQSSVIIEAHGTLKMQACPPVYMYFSLYLWSPVQVARSSRRCGTHVCTPSGWGGVCWQAAKVAVFYPVFVLNLPPCPLPTLPPLLLAAAGHVH